MFIRKKFGDGDREIHLPKWRQIAYQEQANLYATNLQEDNEQSKKIGAGEPAIRHEDGLVKIEEDGSVVLFANADTGMILNAKDNQAILFGDDVHVDSQIVHFHTNQNQLLWNQKQITEEVMPELHCNCKCTSCQKLSAMMSNKVFLRTIPRKRSDGYSDETITAKLKQLGIYHKERGSID
jgi:hypothetical protein